MNKLVTITLKKLVTIDIKQIQQNTIIWYPEIKDFCSRPYSGHKKGCPNIEKCKNLNIPDFGTLNKKGQYNYYYVVYAKFDFKQYKQLRKEKHQNWSDRQLGNLYHWQNSIKSMLRRYINNLYLDSNTYVLSCGSGFILNHQKIVGSMENSWINVISTMKLNNIKMEVKPKNIIYLVCLLMCKNKLKSTTNKMF